MSFGEQMKNKADQVGLDAKAKDLGDAIAALAKEAVSLLTSAAKENQGKIEGAIDKAASSVDEKAGGKHAERIAKDKAQATTGFEKLVEQGDKVSGGGPSTESRVSHIPGTTIPDGSQVPEDTHSAFDDAVTSEANGPTNANGTTDVTDATTDQSASGNPS